MSRVVSILVLIIAFFFSSCSKILGFGQSTEKEPNHIPVSMEYDGVFMEEDNPEWTNSKFYLRKHSFSYYIRTYFTSSGMMSLKMLISSGEGFELNKWYSLPSAESENVWESFAIIKGKRAIAGRILFTEFNQTGDLTFNGEGYCSIRGEFEITLESEESSDKSIEIKNGKFYVPKSGYWDSRAMED